MNMGIHCQDVVINKTITAICETDSPIHTQGKDFRIIRPDINPAVTKLMPAYFGADLVKGIFRQYLQPGVAMGLWLLMKTE